MNLDNLSADELDELLDLLEADTTNTFVLIHSVPRPRHPGQPAPDESGNYVLTIRCV